MRQSGMMVVALAAFLAAPASADDAVSGLRACRALTDQTARLACFDRLAAQYDVPTPVTQAAPPAAPSAAPGVAQSAPQPAAKAVPEFGGERLARPDDTPRPEESMTAVVAKASLNAIGHFTIALDNGQIWRQLDSDTANARFRGSDRVKITKGFLDSYSLAIEGQWGTYKVKRIK